MGRSALSLTGAFLLIAWVGAPASAEEAIEDLLPGAWSGVDETGGSYQFTILEDGAWHVTNMGRKFTSTWRVTGPMSFELTSDRTDFATPCEARVDGEAMLIDCDERGRPFRLRLER